MPVPEFNELKAPALQLFADGQPRRISEIYDRLAEHFNLTSDELEEMLPSGTQSRWHNRANWACYDMYRAGFLDRPRRGVYIITELGKSIAAQKPAVIDRDFLMQYPKFVEFVQATSTTKVGKTTEVTADDTKATLETQQTPQEMLELAYQQLNAALKREVLDLVLRMDPFRFEQLVLDLMIAMGYGGSREEAATVTKATNDEGIDGIINEDRLGLDVIYLQAKRWKERVGRKEIQSFVGALAGQQANKGVFITTSDFADTAKDYAKHLPQKVILIDGNRLADLMIKHNIGISLNHAYEVKHVDSDYFSLE